MLYFSLISDDVFYPFLTFYRDIKPSKSLQIINAVRCSFRVGMNSKTNDHKSNSALSPLPTCHMVSLPYEFMEPSQYRSFNITALEFNTVIQSTFNCWPFTFARSEPLFVNQGGFVDHHCYLFWHVLRINLKITATHVINFQKNFQRSPDPKSISPPYLL